MIDLNQAAERVLRTLADRQDTGVRFEVVAGRQRIAGTTVPASPRTLRRLAAEQLILTAGDFGAIAYGGIAWLAGQESARPVHALEASGSTAPVATCAPTHPCEWSLKALDSARAMLGRLLARAGHGAHLVALSLPPVGAGGMTRTVYLCTAGPELRVALMTSQAAGLLHLLAEAIAHRSGGGLLLRTTRPAVPNRVHAWALYDGFPAPMREDEAAALYPPSLWQTYHAGYDLMPPSEPVDWHALDKADAEADVLTRIADLRGRLRDGFGAADVDEIFGRIADAGGPYLVCVWDHETPTGLGGGTAFYVEAEHGFFTLPRDVADWLRGDRDEPGPLATWTSQPAGAPACVDSKLSHPHSYARTFRAD